MQVELLIHQVCSAAVPELIARLDDIEFEVSEVRANAAWALGRIGPAASAAIPELSTRLSDWSDEVRTNAAEALELIDTKKKE